MGRPKGSKNKVKVSSQTDIERKIGKKMLELRAKLGITTTELAVKLNMSQAQISRLENGHQGFRGKTLEKISAALGVKPVYFYTDDKKTIEKAVRETSESIYGSGLSEEIRNLMDFPRFKNFLSKSARMFLKDPKRFDKVEKILKP